MAGEYVIIKQGRYGADIPRVIALNATPNLLWQELQCRDFEVEDVVKVLTDNYDVERQVALTDAIEWMAKLEEADLVE